MWQYTDSSNRVVFRVNEDGSMESHFVTVDIIQQWVAAGNTILPYNSNTGEQS
jgi:hypothetical protein